MVEIDQDFLLDSPCPEIIFLCSYTMATHGSLRHQME